MRRVVMWFAASRVAALLALAGCAPGAVPDAAPVQAGATAPNAPTDDDEVRDASVAAEPAPGTIPNGTVASANPAAYDGPRVAPGVDLSAAHEIVRRECDVRRYGSSWTIEPGTWCSGSGCGPGIRCTRPEDCPASPHGRCLTSVEGRCDYGAGPTDEIGCVADDECRASPDGRCLGVISQTSCQYNNECTIDADCSDSPRCDCGSSGDLICVEVDCLSDADCPDGERCFRSNPCNFGPYGDYRCTTPDDECVPYSDPCGCDFDVDQRHWVCMNIICD